MNLGTTQATALLPDEVDDLDVELALAAHLPLEVVPEALDWARAHGIGRRTLRAWLGTLEADGPA